MQYGLLPYTAQGGCGMFYFPTLHRVYVECFTSLHCTGRYWISLLLMHSMDAVWFTSLHCTGWMWNILLPYTALVDIGSLYYYYYMVYT